MCIPVTTPTTTTTHTQQIMYAASRGSNQNNINPLNSFTTMARVYLNLPVMTISGSLKKSDKYCFVTRNGKTFTRAKGERVAPLTEKEKASHSRFRRAVDWANLVQRNDDLVVHYRNMWKESSMKCPNFRGWLIQYYYHHFPSHN